MNRLIRIVSLITTVLIVGGCNLLPETPPPPSEHDLGQLADFAPSSQLPQPVTLTGVDAPSWLEGRQIRYRRLSREPSVIQAYARHQWVAPPPELLERYIEQRLERASGSMDSARQSPWRLSLMLDGFEQTFSGSERSHAVIRFRAELRSPAGAVFARKTFVQRKRTAPEVDGAVTGLSTVADGAVTDLEQWLAAQMQKHDA